MTCWVNCSSRGWGRGTRSEEPRCRGAGELLGELKLIDFLRLSGFPVGDGKRRARIPANEEGSQRWFMECVFQVHEVGLVARPCNDSPPAPAKGQNFCRGGRGSLLEGGGALGRSLDEQGGDHLS